jgi:predicted dehydrogenase
LHDFLEAPETFAEFQFKLRVGDLVIPTLQFGEPLRSECQHFIDCVRSGNRPVTDGSNGLRVVKVLEAAELSLKQQGRPIEISNEMS